MNNPLRSMLVWICIFGALMFVFNDLMPRNVNNGRQVTYSRFLHELENHHIDRVFFDDDMIYAKTRDNTNISVINPETSNSALIGQLIKHGVAFEAKEPKQQSTFTQILISWFPMLLLIGVWIYFAKRMQGGSGGPGGMGLGKSKAKLLSEDQVKVTFKDVAGAEEAKEEVAELVEFLQAPEKFSSLGGQIPRGILMIGPPGTGKTLLARAIAGEAKVPFFTISGSDFVEMFVGVGASRVRDMFEQAKKQAPCLIFIDEIDAVGRRRGAGLGGGHDEREQTLNQLLVEMDGFGGNEGVIVIAATNRPDVLDPALLRPGRFDRQVTVGLPDIQGREQILKVHMRKVPLANGVEPSVLARGTPGFSGADLANLVNEASLFAARSSKDVVEMADFERALDKIIMGAERHSMIMSDEEKRMTAYHEAGHAIVGRLVPSHDPVYKMSIIPRGRALGVTMFLPERDSYSRSKEQLESQLSSLFGGRVAEELIFGPKQVTTGASNDIERATQIARNMVTKWGLSEKLGPLAYSEDEGEVFLGHSVTQHKMMSEETNLAIDEEIRRLVDKNYQRTKTILEENIDILHAMAEALIKYETVDKDQIDDVMNGRPPRPPKKMEDERNEPQSPEAKPKEKKVIKGSDDPVTDPRS